MFIEGSISLHSHVESFSPSFALTVARLPKLRLSFIHFCTVFNHLIHFQAPIHSPQGFPLRLMFQRPPFETPRGRGACLQNSPFYKLNKSLGGKLNKAQLTPAEGKWCCNVISHELKENLFYGLTNTSSGHTHTHHCYFPETRMGTILHTRQHSLTHTDTFKVAA